MSSEIRHDSVRRYVEAAPNSSNSHPRFFKPDCALKIPSWGMRRQFVRFVQFVRDHVRVNGLQMDSKVPSNLSERPSFLVKRNSDLYVPAGEKMFLHMRDVRDDFQIAPTIVSLIAVSMVNFFRRFKSATQLFFSHKPVFKNVFSVYTQAAIAALVNISDGVLLFSPQAAFSGAKTLFASLLRRGSRYFLAARGARFNDAVFSAHVENVPQ